ncbi:MAG: hypothetical protein JNM84_18790 [Planctomycetes bacterium]|nr:hypothetical protein [Planctomycetota bacterium]
MERIQSLLGPLAGLALAVAIRFAHELTSRYQQLDPLPGFATLAFVWVILDLRLRLRDRAENRTLLELRTMAAGSVLRAELLEHARVQIRALLLLGALLLPSFGLPGALSTAVAASGSVILAVALVEGGTQRFGVPNVFLAIALAWFWMGAGDLAPEIPGPLDPWSRSPHPAVDASTASLALCLRAALAQLALGLALRLLFLEPANRPTPRPSTGDQLRR